jgi:hypothetical protein
MFILMFSEPPDANVTEVAGTLTSTAAVSTELASATAGIASISANDIKRSISLLLGVLVRIFVSPLFVVFPADLLYIPPLSSLEAPVSSIREGYGAGDQGTSAQGRIFGRPLYAPRVYARGTYRMAARAFSSSIRPGAAAATHV